MASSGSHGLRNYIIRRLLLVIPTLFGVALIVFTLCQFVPGGPVDQLRLRMAGAGGGGEAGGGSARRTGSGSYVSEDHLIKDKEYLGFDKPVHVRFKNYIVNLATLDFGNSIRFSTPVTKLLKKRLPVSLYYGILTTIFTYSICIPLGIVKAIRHRTVLDNVSSFLIFCGYAIPSFALGAVLLALFSVKYDIFPLGDFKSPNFSDLSAGAKVKDIVMHSVLPMICYMVGAFAITTMLVKNSLLENMSADYVKTALANGIHWRRAIFVHALRNSLIPLATGFGGIISLVLTGSILIERVFNIQGMGLLYFESMVSRDYIVVMAVTLISSALLVLGNILSDICVALVDPRVRFE